MKAHRFVILVLAGGLLASVGFSTFGQAERVKLKAKDLKKQVEDNSAGKTNTPPPKPKR